MNRGGSGPKYAWPFQSSRSCETFDTPSTFSNGLTPDLLSSNFHWAKSVWTTKVADALAPLDRPTATSECVPGRASRGAAPARPANAPWASATTRATSLPSNERTTVSPARNPARCTARRDVGGPTRRSRDREGEPDRGEAEAPARAEPTMARLAATTAAIRTARWRRNVCRSLGRVGAGSPQGHWDRST